MGLRELFSRMIASAALLSTAARGTKHRKEDFSKAFVSYDCLFR